MHNKNVLKMKNANNILANIILYTVENITFCNRNRIILHFYE